MSDSQEFSAGVGVPPNLPPEHLIARATQAYMHGALGEAETLCRQALQSNPDLPVANMMLGSLCARRGELAGAEEAFRKVVSTTPNAYEAWEWLANITRETGRTAESSAIAKKLIGLQPNAPGGYMALALCLLKERRVSDALPLLDKSVLLAPNVPLFRHNLGSAYKDAGRPEEALKQYKMALDLDPNLLKTNLAIATLLISLRRTDEALPYLQKLAQAEPSSFTYTQLAHGLAEEERYEEAEQWIRKAIELDPNAADAHGALGIHLLHLGRLEEAGQSFQRSLEIDPTSASGYFGLSRTRRFTEQDRNLIARMETLAEEPRPEEDLRELHYALGKAYDDLGDYRKAFGHYALANEYSKKTQLANRPFDKKELEDETSAVLSTFTKEFFETHPDLGRATNLPIFIIGMIRSGTTLVEQILSSHSQIGAGGELKFWSDEPARAVHSEILHGEMDKAKLRSMADDYLRELRNKVPELPLATDKMPLNYASLGLIHLLLPNARIIHCKRDPLDTCVSIFTTPYREAPNFFYDLDNIVEGYLDYQRLMAHWRRVIPPDLLLEVQYEELISDRETQSKRMVTFLGLEWDEACLHPEQNERTVYTPSAWQVRQQVYTGSVGRWKNYEPWLGPLVNTPLTSLGQPLL